MSDEFVVEFCFQLISPVVHIHSRSVYPVPDGKFKIFSNIVVNISTETLI